MLRFKEWTNHKRDKTSETRPIATSVHGSELQIFLSSTKVLIEGFSHVILII